MPFIPPPFSQIRGIQTAKIFNQVATLNPLHPYAYILSDKDATVREIVSWNQFLKDSRDAALLLRQKVHFKEDVVIGVLATHGYVYAVHFIAVLMNNWVVSSSSFNLSNLINTQPLLLSPTNGTDGNILLLNSSNAVYFLSDEHMYDRSIPLSETTGIKMSKFVSIDQIRSSSPDPSDPLPYERESSLSKEEIENKPSFLLHTSGSTGHPKTITLVRSFIY